MKILVDCGNSGIKWGLGDPETLTLHGPWRLADNPLQPAGVWDGLEPKGLHYCTVVDSPLLQEILDGVETQWALAPRAVRSGVESAGLHTAYDVPDTLGADRWANLIAARSLYPEQDCVVVDAGTAVTVDGLTASGRHIGGAIFAGLRAMRAGLHAVAPALPEVSGRGAIPATNTQDAVAGGTHIGLVGAVARLAVEIGSQLHAPALILTGGDANELAAELGARWEVDSQLTLRGILLAGESA